MLKNSGARFGRNKTLRNPVESANLLDGSIEKLTAVFQTAAAAPNCFDNKPQRDTATELKQRFNTVTPKIHTQRWVV